MPITYMEYVRIYNDLTKNLSLAGLQVILQNPRYSLLPKQVDISAVAREVEGEARWYSGMMEWDRPSIGRFRGKHGSLDHHLRI